MKVTGSACAAVAVATAKAAVEMDRSLFIDIHPLFRASGALFFQARGMPSASPFFGRSRTSGTGNPEAIVPIFQAQVHDAAASSHALLTGPPRPYHRRQKEMHMKALTPKSIRPPFARYSHGVEVPAGKRLVLCSGQLGIGPEDAIPEDAGAQAELCFANIAAILAEAGLGLKDIVRINAFVTDRAHMKGYMEVRDQLVADPPPASTLVIVSGFTRPEFKVEIEVIAAG